MIKVDRYAYNVALSFSGEQLRYVKKVYHALNKKGLKVFYDESPDVQAAHLGKRFTEVAQRVYGETAEFVVIFASKEYLEKQWPYLESAYVLDRMRAQLFRENNVLIGKFGKVDLPGFPNDIWWSDLSSIKAAAFADIVANAIACRKTIDQDAILTMFAREQFSTIVSTLTAALAVGVKYEDHIFALYCRACARSRMAEPDRASEDELLQAASDISNCLHLVREQRPHYAAKLSEFANRDDDLLALRTALQDRMRDILRVDQINLRPTKTAYLNAGGPGGGCVDPTSLICTATGLTAIKDLTLSSSVLSYDHPSDQKRPTTVLHLRANHDEPKFEIDRSITVSSTQPLYERHKEWTLAQDLRVGMELLRSDGSFSVIQEMRYRGHGSVMILGVSDQAHTFIADGYVCHNIDKS